jgi:hypothetical protein
MHIFFMIWRVSPTLAHIPFVRTVSERIIISNYSYNMNIQLICYLLLNTIGEFLVSRFIDVKRVEYKDPTLLWTYHC